MAPEVLRAVLITVVLLVAAWTDTRSGRIPNRLTAAVVVLAFLLAALPGQPGGSLWVAGQGLLWGAALLLPFYVLRLMGAGDVKLMAALGALMGWPDIGWLMLLTLVCAGLLSVVLALRWGVGRQVVSHVHQALVGLLFWRALGRSAGDALVVPQTGYRSPHAVAMALAWLVFLAGRTWGWGGW
jgi:prepilin peptidase CpaA